MCKAEGRRQERRDAHGIQRLERAVRKVDDDRRTNGDEDDARRKTRMKRVKREVRWRGVVKCQQDVTRLNSVETVQVALSQKEKKSGHSKLHRYGRAWAKTRRKTGATRCRRGVEKNYSEMLVAKGLKGAKSGPHHSQVRDRSKERSMNSLCRQQGEKRATGEDDPDERWHHIDSVANN